MTTRPRVLLADDHQILAEGLRGLLMKEFDLVGWVEDGLSLLAKVAEVKPDAIVADISMPQLNGIDATRRLRKEHPEIKVVILTMHHDAVYARRALEAGAAGFVLKQAAATELVSALHAALAGQTYITPSIAGEVFKSMQQSPEMSNDPIESLTPRQREVLQLLVEGYSAKRIAECLNVSTRTVEYHKYQMMDRLAVSTSAELVRFALKHGNGTG